MYSTLGGVASAVRKYLHMIVVVAGRRIDLPNAAVSRFPLSYRGTVAQRITAALKDLQATVVVSSAACGSDLLAINAARARQLRRRIVLPYQEDWFLVDSVTDRPGRWEDLFAQVMSEAREAGDLIVLSEPRGSDDAYRAANDRILAEALDLARAENPENSGAALAGLIVWEGAPRGPDDLTDHMRRHLEAAGARIVPVISRPDPA
jgi:hypothetical protein